MAALWLSIGESDSTIRTRFARLIAVGLAALLLLLGLDRGAAGFPEPAGAMPLIVASTVLVIVALLLMRRQVFDRLAVITGVIVIVVLSIEVIVTFGGNLYGLDVYRSHEAAAEAIREADNPYTNAVVVVDGSPNAEPGDLIEGYSYPPVTLVGYVVGDLLGGDPRWASVVAIAATALVMAAIGYRRGPEVVGMVLLLAISVPLIRAIVWSGWTEPLSLALLVFGVLLWPRRWLSPVLLGLALASKQYLVVLVPVLVMIDSRPWRRSIVALSVAGLTLVPALMADASSFWFTMVTRPLSLGFRADTRSLAGAFAEMGLDVRIPTWLMLLSVLVVSSLLARRIDSRSDALAAMALVLGVTFSLSLAFTNYWWLVQWLAGASAVMWLADREEPTIRSASATST